MLSLFGNFTWCYSMWFQSAGLRGIFPYPPSPALHIFGPAPSHPNLTREKKLPHPSLDFTLIDYSHSDHRRLDNTQLDYLWRLDDRRTKNTFGLFQLDLLRRLDYTPKRLQ